VFEATYGWSWFADLLADVGIPAHMAHPLATKAISAARVKNDAVDAKTLAHLLRTNLLAEAWIAPPDAREARRLVRTRAGLVRMRSRVQSQLHALLADLGVIPELTTLFGPAGRRWLAELGMPASARGRLDAGLRLIDAITVEVAHADADLRACLAGDHRVRRLLPIPGVGLVTAATVVAEVWDIGRFPSPERLCSWAGLTPGERTSDAPTRRGHITKQGSRWLRWMLVEAATTAVRDPQLGRFAAQIAQRRGPKIARVALARRLLTLCYYALRDQDGCRAYPVPAR
jgi:transposase